MGYSTDAEGNVVLRMTTGDYMGILIALGCATGVASRDGESIKPWLELVDRINEGNPDYQPYTKPKPKQ